MISRKSFIKTTSLAAAGLAAKINANPIYNMNGSELYKSNRPKVSERTFTSDAIERAISKVKKGISNPELSWLFENCFPNTLDTTVDYEVIDGKPDAFIITGDIDAMWLRDSTAQIWPYLPFVKEDPKLKDLS